MSAALKPRAVIFDLYRTLVNITTDEGKDEAWKTLASFLGYRGLSVEWGALREAYFAERERLEETSKEAHPEVKVPEVFAAVLGGLGHRGRGRGPSRFSVEVSQLFRVLSMEHIELYPDTLSTLHAIRERGMRLALVSDAQRPFILPELRMLGLAPLFGRRVVISSDQRVSKPSPLMFRAALDQLRLRPDQAVYVGDNVERDIRGARAAKLATVLIRRSRGAAPSNGDSEADATITSLGELLPLLAG